MQTIKGYVTLLVTDLANRSVISSATSKTRRSKSISNSTTSFKFPLPWSPFPPFLLTKFAQGYFEAPLQHLAAQVYILQRKFICYPMSRNAIDDWVIFRSKSGKYKIFIAYKVTSGHTLIDRGPFFKVCSCIFNCKSFALERDEYKCSRAIQGSGASNSLAKNRRW